MLDTSNMLGLPVKQTLLPLKVTNLSYRSANKPLLHDINIVVDDPGITVMFGPNGAGKSLFVRLIHGLLKPTIGSISWNSKSPDLTTRRCQALVFQKPILLRRSVAANIDFVLKSKIWSSHHYRDEILRAAGLLECATQPARSLSGGEQQRLALVRALATEPQVLLLDEPSASLDPATTQKIEILLQQTRDRGVKLILVTHDIAQAQRLADDVVFICGGRLCEHTPAEQFFNRPYTHQARAYLEGQLVF